MGTGADERSRPLRRRIAGASTADLLTANQPVLWSFPFENQPPGGLWGFRDTGFSASRHSVGGYLRSAGIGCRGKSHPSRYLQRSVSPRIDNLPERDAGLRDFALVPQLPLEFPGCPALHGAQRARASEFWNSPMGDEPFGVAGPLQTSSICWNSARYPPIEFRHITGLRQRGVAGPARRLAWSASSRRRRRRPSGRGRRSPRRRVASWRR